MKIVFLQNATRLKQMFTAESIRKLSELGTLVIRDSGKDATHQEQKQMLVNADIAVTSWGCSQLNLDMITQSPKLSMVFHAGGSIKPVFEQELFDKGIRIASNARILGIGVAETALGMTISSLKNLWQVSKDVSNGGWNENYNQIRELYNIKIGVIGAGFAGRHYIKLMKNFDVNVLLYDPYVDAQKASELGAIKVELNELLKQADVVSIHAPSIPETNHMFCHKTFELMKDNAILINTARGSLIDENDLYEHMVRGKLQYACIDVTDPEPPAPNHPLRSLPNVIFSPHLAGLTNNGLERIGKNVVAQIQSFCEGTPVDGEITANMLTHIA